MKGFAEIYTSAQPRYHAPMMLFLLSLSLAAAAAEGMPAYVPCSQDPTRQAARSEELQNIVQADQAAREKFNELIGEKLLALGKADVARRTRVGAIFGEGCFSKAADYAAAALVFQHGDSPDHFMQTFLWAKRAVELGDASQKRLMALAIDRYLVNIGHKQLFGSQAFSEHPGEADDCHCLDPIEKSFPEKLRREYMNQSLADLKKWAASLDEGKHCGPVAECKRTIKSSPKGTMPGFW